MKTKRKDREEDIEEELPRKKFRGNDYIDDKSYETLIIDEYEKNKLLDDMHYEISELNRKRKKDKEVLNTILSYGDDASQSQVSKTSETFSKDNDSFGTIKSLATKAVQHFSLPLLLFIANKLIASYKPDRSIGNSNSSHNNSGSMETKSNPSGLFK